jgi:hypothetical protein
VEVGEEVDEIPELTEAGVEGLIVAVDVVDMEAREEVDEILELTEAEVEVSLVVIDRVRELVELINDVSELNEIEVEGLLAAVNIIDVEAEEKVYEIPQLTESEVEVSLVVFDELRAVVEPLNEVSELTEAEAEGVLVAVDVFDVATELNDDISELADVEVPLDAIEVADMESKLLGLAKAESELIKVKLSLDSVEITNDAHKGIAELGEVGDETSELSEVGRSLVSVEEIIEENVIELTEIDSTWLVSEVAEDGVVELELENNADVVPVAEEEEI